MKQQILNFSKGIGTILLYFFLSILGAELFGNYYYCDNFWLATLSQLATYILMLVVLALIYHKRLINDFINLKKEHINIALQNWIIGLCLMMACNIIINMIVGDIATNESVNRSLLGKYPTSNIISMILIGPMLEELTFRASFKNAFKKWYTFSLVTGLLFGSAHIIAGLLSNGVSFQEFLFIIPYGVLGFFFGKAFFETNNIYTSLIAHMTHNALCVLLLLI